MSNQEQLEILKQGIDTWNQWRADHLFVRIDLSGADLSKANLSEVNLSITEPSEANLRRAGLSEDQLYRIQTGVDLSRATLVGANLGKAELGGANLSEADLSHASLKGASLIVANLENAKLRDANLSKADLWGANFSGADLRGAILDKAKIGEAYLIESDLTGAHLKQADLSEAKLGKADLSDAELVEANLSRADLSKANLSRADLSEANLSRADLSEADLSRADLELAYLIFANLDRANLSETCLMGSNLIQASIHGGIISKSSIYGVNVWDLDGEFCEQRDLIITLPDESKITVDNIEIAQFIYLILNNRKIRDAINTLTSKTVLILGRFSIPERKSILDGLRNRLREYDLVSVVFDFDRPTDKDFTETIKTLAGISYFVIADVTNPKSSPLELQATVPDYQIPFVPIIQEGEHPFPMMVDLQKKYSWVLNTVTYDSTETLMKALKPLIIDPAMKKRQELRLIKAQEPEIISAKEFLAKSGL